MNRLGIQLDIHHPSRNALSGVNSLTLQEAYSQDVSLLDNTTPKPKIHKLASIKFSRNFLKEDRVKLISKTKLSKVNERFSSLMRNQNQSLNDHLPETSSVSTATQITPSNQRVLIHCPSGGSVSPMTNNKYRSLSVQRTYKNQTSHHPYQSMINSNSKQGHLKEGLRSKRNQSQQHDSHREDSQDRSPTFPILKYHVRQDFPLMDNETLKTKINKVIHAKGDKNYNYDNSTFKMIENGNNFRKKLQQIDDIVKQNLFKATYNNIMPQYYYKKDEILTSKSKRQLVAVKHNTGLHTKKISTIWDHQGNLITKSGSRLDGISEMLRKELPGNKKQRNLELNAQKSYQMTQNVSTNVSVSKKPQIEVNKEQEEEKEEIDDEQYAEFNAYWEDLSKEAHKKVDLGKSYSYLMDQLPDPDQKRDNSKSVRVERPLRGEFAKLFRKQSTVSGGKSNKSRNNGVQQSRSTNRAIDLTAQMKEWFIKNIDKQIDQDKQQQYLKQLDHFKGHLDRQLESDYGEDRSSQADEHLNDKDMIEQLYSSFFLEEREKQQAKRKEQKLTKMILQTLIGKNEESIGMKKALKENQGLDQNISEIHDKMDFLQDINKAHVFLKHLQKKNATRSKRVMGQEAQQMENVTSKLMVQLQELQKDIEDKDGIEEDNLNGAMKELVRECAKLNVIPPQMFKQVQDNKVSFSNMNIQRGLCKALAKSLKKCVPHPLEYIVFQNNNLDDESFGIILEALVEIDGLRGMYIIQNTVDKISTQHIVSLLQKQPPNHLEELVLNATKMQSQFITQIVDTLKNHCQLRILGLSQQKLDISSSQALISLIQNSKQLKNLDISYCQFYKAKALVQMLKDCATSHTLQYLNISFNPVRDSLKQDYVTALKAFIIGSKTLTHLNLSGCGLYKHYSIQIFESVKKAKTLQCLHFSGNELESSSLKAIRELLKCEVEKSKHEEGLYTQQEAQTDHPSIERKQSNNKKDKNFEKRTKPITDIHYEEKHIPANDVYIYTRILGHLEIQDGHIWKERNECWICNKWQYVAVLWSELVAGYFYENKPINNLSQYELQIRLANNFVDIYNNQNQKPIIFSDSLRFKHHLMSDIKDFVNRLELNHKPHTRIIDEEQLAIKQKNQVNQSTQVSPRFKPAPDFKQRTEEERTIVQINREWPKQLKKQFHLLDEAQHTVDLMELLDLKLRSDERYYAYANYFPPGAAQIFIQSQNKQKAFSYKQLEVNARHTDIGIGHKRVKKVRMARQFMLKQSVFSQWFVDIEEEYKKCFESDMKYSKIKKFVKDPEHFQQVCDVLLENYGKILELYLYSNGMSNYPSVQWIEFTDFCNDWNIIDRNLTLATIDRLFIAVNFEGVPGGLEDNPDKELCRYEFFEIVVRMAVAKYPTLTPPEALKNILYDYLFEYGQPLSWFKFRQELIWTLDVDDLLKANMSTIKRLYKTAFTGLKRTFTLDDAKQMIFQSSLQMNEKQVQTAFAYSKFLMTDEMENNEMLTQLNFGEFMEFIPRVAQILFPSPSQSLFDKIHIVLTELFKGINAKVVMPYTNDLGDSESDYDELY